MNMQGSGSEAIRLTSKARVLWMMVILFLFAGPMETKSTPLAHKDVSYTTAAPNLTKTDNPPAGKESKSEADIAKEKPAVTVAAKSSSAVKAAEPQQSEDDAQSVFESMRKMSAEPLPYLDLKQFEKVEVVATGYSADIESTGKSPGHPEYGITYSGVRVRKDTFSTIAADPKVFPLGTILFIPGYGFGVVADTGSAIKGYKLDLYFQTKAQVYREWGKRKVHVYVLKRGDGKVTELMMDRLNSIKAVPANNQM